MSTVVQNARCSTPIDQADLAELREQLSFRIDDQVEWRTQKAAQYPWDTGNQRSADSLDRLRENLEALDLDHPLWFRLWNVFHGPNAPADFYEVGELESDQLRQYGLHGSDDGDAIKFLEGYVVALESHYQDVHATCKRVQ